MAVAKKKKKNLSWVFSNAITLTLILCTLNLTAQQKLRLWYDKPANMWEETLPLGNGRLGMTPDGGISKEKIVLNDITLWSGSPQDANNYQANKSLPEIRSLILEGKNDEAQAVHNGANFKYWVR
jgi:alpha-L-fucosidase 2